MLDMKTGDYELFYCGSNVFTVLGFNFIGITNEVFFKKNSFVPRSKNEITYWFFFTPVFKRIIKK